MRSKHAGQAGCETRTNDDMHVALASVLIKPQQRTNISEVIGRADNVNALSNKLFSNMRLGPSRTSEHNNINIKRIVERAAVDAGAITKAVGHEFNAVATFIAKHDLIVVGRYKLPSETRANSADSENPDARHVSRGPGRTVHATRQSEEVRHLIRGAERRRRQAPPCRWQPWPVGSFSSWG